MSLQLTVEEEFPCCDPRVNLEFPFRKMSDMESKDDDANLLSPLLLEVHQDVQSFTTLFKDTFTAPLSTEHTSKLLNTAFKLIASQDGDTSKINMVYLLFCLHAHGGVDVLKIPLRTLRMLPKIHI